MPPHRGGIAAYTRGLDRALREACHSTKVIGFRRLYPSLLFPGRSQFEPGVGVPDGAGDRGLAVIDVCRPATWRRANRMMRDFAPEAVVVQWWHPIAGPALGVALSGLHSAKIVCVCHNVEPHERFPGSRWLAAPACRRFAGALCHSGWVAERFHERYPRAAVVRVAMPLLLEAASADKGGSGGIPACVFTKDGPLVVFLGLLRPYKGVDLLIEAWGRAELPPGARLLLAGESYLGRGRLRSMVAACARSDSIVIEDRYLDDREFMAILRAADLLVLPYRRASQSGLVPMAAAVATPMLVSDAGGLGEQCSRFDGVESFRSGDADSLTRALLRCFARIQNPSLSALRQADATAPAERQPCTSPARSWARVVEALEGLVRQLQ